MERGETVGRQNRPELWQPAHLGVFARERASALQPVGLHGTAHAPGPIGCLARPSGANELAPLRLFSSVAQIALAASFLPIGVRDHISHKSLEALSSTSIAERDH